MPRCEKNTNKIPAVIDSLHKIVRIMFRVALRLKNDLDRLLTDLAQDVAHQNVRIGSWCSDSRGEQMARR